MPLYRLRETTVVTYYIEAEDEAEAESLYQNADVALLDLRSKPYAAYPPFLKDLWIEDDGGIEIDEADFLKALEIARAVNARQAGTP